MDRDVQFSCCSTFQAVGFFFLFPFLMAPWKYETNIAQKRSQKLTQIQDRNWPPSYLRFLTRASGWLGGMDRAHCKSTKQKKWAYCLRDARKMRETCCISASITSPTLRRSRQRRTPMLWHLYTPTIPYWAASAARWVIAVSSQAPGGAWLYKHCKEVHLNALYIEYNFKAPKFYLDSARIDRQDNGRNRLIIL